MDLIPAPTTPIANIASIKASRGAFVALKTDKTVIAWGEPKHGGDISAVASQLVNIVSIFSGTGAHVSMGTTFGAITEDGAVITWGAEVPANQPAHRYISPPAAQLMDGVTRVVSSLGAFAAIKADTSVVTWGIYEVGGDSSAVASDLSIGVVDISTNGYAFAALKDDGSVVTWGDNVTGGDCHSVRHRIQDGATIVSTVGGYPDTKNIECCTPTPSKVPQCYPSFEGRYQLNISLWTDTTFGDVSQIKCPAFGDRSRSFAALNTDGSVVTWGDKPGGGSSLAVKGQLVGVTSIAATMLAFAALKTDKTVVTWGEALYGGDSSEVTSQLVDVVSITASSGAFAALKTDKTVVIWGHPLSGGVSGVYSPPVSGSEGTLVSMPSQLVNITSITPSLGSFGSYNKPNGAFAALTTDGLVVAWGDAEYGADIISSSQYCTGPGPCELKDVMRIDAISYKSFVAVKNDGTLVRWSSKKDKSYADIKDFTDAQKLELVDIASVHGAGSDSSMGQGWVALKNDGTALYVNRNVDMDDCVGCPTSFPNVASISHTGEHFAALKTDGNVATFPLCNGKDLPDFGNLASPCGTTESHFTESYVKIASELVGITRIEANGGAHPSGQRPHAHKN